MSAHRLVEAAAAGRFPDWTVAGPERRAHARRVADLMATWAAAMGLPRDEADRWCAVGILHDTLRDEEPERLRGTLPREGAGLPDSLLHGPAAAARLRDEGVRDEELLRAIAHHSTGHPDFGPMGRFLYMADFLEPGRRFRAEWRAGLRERAPHEPEAVLREVIRARIAWALERGLAIRPETVELWNEVLPPEAEPEVVAPADPAAARPGDAG